MERGSSTIQGEIACQCEIIFDIELSIGVIGIAAAMEGADEHD